MNKEERTILLNIPSLIGTYRGLNHPLEGGVLNQLFLAIEEIIFYLLESKVRGGREIELKDDEIHVSLVTDLRTRKRAINELIEILCEERGGR